MVMIAKAFNGLRKMLKKKVLRRRRKGSTQTFEPRNSISEAEIEGEANAVEEVSSKLTKWVMNDLFLQPQEAATAPQDNSSSLESLSSSSESSELAGVRSSSLSDSPSMDDLSPATAPIDHGVSNPNVS